MLKFGLFIKKNCLKTCANAKDDLLLYQQSKQLTSQLKKNSPRASARRVRNFRAVITQKLKS